MEENYHLRKSDFYKPIRGMLDYNDRNYLNGRFRVQWREMLLAATHVVFPIITAIGLGFAATFYFEGRFEEKNIRDSTTSAINLEEEVAGNSVVNSHFFTKDL